MATRKSPVITKPKRDKAGWTREERMFVKMYPLHPTQTQAAIAAGFAGTPKAAAEWASRAMARPHVRLAIEKDREARCARLSFDADDVLRGILQLKAEAECLADQGIATLKVRREILKDAGEHVKVGAFRRNVGLSSPTGGPIETIDLSRLAQCTDEELEILERARAIIERVTASAAPAQHVGDQGGTGSASEGA